MSEEIKPGTTTVNDIIEEAVKEIERLDERNRKLEVTLYRIRNALVLQPNYSMLKEQIAKLIGEVL